MGFISAILSIYDIVKVFIEKLAEIAAVVKSFVDSIVSIAAGEIASAASRAGGRARWAAVARDQFPGRLPGARQHRRQDHGRDQEGPGCRGQGAGHGDRVGDRQGEGALFAKLFGGGKEDKHTDQQKQADLTKALAEARQRFRETQT